MRRWVVNAYDPNGTFVDRASFRRYWTRAGAERFARRMRTEGRPVLVPMIVDGTPPWWRAWADDVPYEVTGRWPAKALR